MILNQEYFVSKYENLSVHELRKEVVRIQTMHHDLEDKDYQDFNKRRILALKSLIKNKVNHNVREKIGLYKISENLSIKIYTDGVSVNIFDTGTFIDMDEARYLTKKINDAIIALIESQNV